MFHYEYIELLYKNPLHPLCITGCGKRIRSGIIDKTGLPRRTYAKTCFKNSENKWKQKRTLNQVKHLPMQTPNTTSNVPQSILNISQSKTNKNTRNEPLKIGFKTTIDIYPMI